MALTGVTDTRLLLTLEFPPTEEIRGRAVELFQKEAARNLLAPSIVLAEFIKIAGAKVGEDAARTRLRLHKDRGMRIVSLDEEEALTVGSIFLSHRDVPIADALIASFVKTRAAEYVVTDDSHYKTLGVKTKWI